MVMTMKKCRESEILLFTTRGNMMMLHIPQSMEESSETINIKQCDWFIRGH